MIKSLFTVFILLHGIALSAQMIQVDEFGTNPGNLEMFLYEPSIPKTGAEVVLVLHGCGQDASNFAEQTGWNVLAEQYGFYVIFAQQKRINNPAKCFNWFLSSDNERDHGEAKSLVQMVTFVHDHYATDATKSFVCGLSAGGSMTPVMMACYPDVFSSGGVWAGVPYLYEPGESNDIDPEEWGERVKNAYPEYTGAYPTLFICQGTEDGITEPINQSRLVAQWTDVHNSDQIADVTNMEFNDNPIVEENIYTNNAKDTIIKSYKILGMGHGIAVDPGSGNTQGGQTSLGSYDVDFYSTYWMAKFFGIIENDTVSTTVDPIGENVNIFTLEDGSLSITLETEPGDQQIIIYDMMGRAILREQLRQVNVFSSKELSSTHIMAISIIDEHNRRIYSKVILR